MEISGTSGRRVQLLPGRRLSARLVFDKVPPLGLTIGLGLATGTLWWFTRPRSRDVFWDIETTGSQAKLRRIIAAREVGKPESADEMMELLKAFPNYQPARLYYADWHYESKDSEAALKGYERAFTLGVAKARHYLRVRWPRRAWDRTNVRCEFSRPPTECCPRTR